MKTLTEIAIEKPFPEYQDWWQVGIIFLQFMSQAIVSEWQAIVSEDDLTAVTQYTTYYTETVYKRPSRPHLVQDFVNQSFTTPIYSGEFDALSYAFYRAAFEQIAKQEPDVVAARRHFTKRVGRKFYSQCHNHLQLSLPTSLTTNDDFDQLTQAITQVGYFLTQQGYLRTHFAFHFDVHTQHAGQAINQSSARFLSALTTHTGHALYEMGYPIILPSAVYLYHTIGEAQHHSSRTIEELFDRIGYEARETDDFDPTQFPSDLVVELWEIRPLSGV